LYITQGNNFHNKDLQVFSFLIEKRSHFLGFSVITALNHLYWRLCPDSALSLNYTELDDKTVYHNLQQFKENLSKREAVVSRRDIGVTSLSERKTSPLLSKDSKQKQTGEGLRGSL
jgi:hypothetical protein